MDDAYEATARAQALRRRGPLRRLRSRISISWQMQLAREDLVRIEAQVARWRAEAPAPGPD